MALKGALSFSLGTSRLLSGGLSRFGAAAQTNGFSSAVAGPSSNESSQPSSQAGNSLLLQSVKNQRTQDMFDQLRFNTAAVMAAKKDEDAKRPAPVSSAVAGAIRGGLRGPMLPSRSRNMMMPRLGSQTRAYNSWTPAQRYFVEGDHVVAAELNRTFQFTGLDSGSFYPLVVYTGVATAISCVFMFLPLLVAPSRVDLDKSSAYECGFDAFGEARQTFSVSFYLVSIMYLLFDIEIAYLFPYVMTHANAQMFWTMNLFLSLLVVGFVYEWGVGALEWRE